MADKLSRELKAYEANFGKLLATHEGKYVLLHGDDVLGFFDSQMDAINWGYKELGNVPFLVKNISKLDIPLSFVSNLLAL
jgi:hypothetical protein